MTEEGGEGLLAATAEKDAQGSAQRGGGTQKGWAGLGYVPKSKQQRKEGRDSANKRNLMATQFPNWKDVAFLALYPVVI